MKYDITPKTRLKFPKAVQNGRE